MIVDHLNFQHQNLVKVFQDFKCIVRIFLLCLELLALKQVVSSYCVLVGMCIIVVLKLVASEKALSGGAARGMNM